MPRTPLADFEPAMKKRLEDLWGTLNSFRDNHSFNNALADSATTQVPLN